MISLRTPSENILELTNPKDLFNSQSQLIKKITLNTIGKEVDIFIKNVEVLKSENKLMTIIHIYFEVFADHVKFKYVWKCHRAKDFSCSQSNIEII